MDNEELQTTYRHFNQFVFRGASKLDVYEHLSGISKITDFILGYDRDKNEVIGEIYTEKRTRIRVLKPYMFKMPNGINGEWKTDPISNIEFYISEIDPQYLVKGNKYRASDLTNEGLGSMIPDVTIPVTPINNNPPSAIYAGNIPSTAIQQIIEGVIAGLRVTNPPPCDTLEEKERQIEELKNTIKELNEEAEGGGSRYSNEILQLKNRLRDKERENKELNEEQKGIEERYKNEILQLRRQLNENLKKQKELEEQATQEPIEEEIPAFYDQETIGKIARQMYKKYNIVVGTNRDNADAWEIRLVSKVDGKDVKTSKSITKYYSSENELKTTLKGVWEELEKKHEKKIK